MGLRLNLILGDQLNRDSLLWHDVDRDKDRFWMAEVKAASSETPSSKQRSVFFLSAMRHFAQTIEIQGFALHYATLSDGYQSFTEALTATLNKYEISQVRCVLPGDVAVMRELAACCQHHQLDIEWLSDNHFISRRGEFRRWMQARRQPRMEHWYRHLRQDRQILMDNNHKPEGGQWNFDKDNRKTFGKNGPDSIPAPLQFKTDAMTRSVISDIENHLPDLPGEIADFNWPVTREQGLEQLDEFIEHRLSHFGDYQDAMWTEQPFLYHARLSACLNLKLLHPMEVITAAEQAYRDGKAPLNAVEGFIRQILGWREYIRGLYWYYRDNWLDYNALDRQRDLPGFYWNAETDMTCMCQSVKQVLTYGYGHHIQRLMVTGLFSLLWGVKPEQIHRWYLGMFIDAVAWVEVPNTIGMSQYADGGIVGSKPYIASGAYIKRMSNYCDHCRFNPKQASGDQACPFTTLYWSFIDHHRDWLSRNPRLGMQVRNWDNKKDDEKQAIRERTNWLYQHLDQSGYKEQG
ncbi:cryptochrome/photolyase family protein [Methylophaga sp.]|jgi:deoxyribodipyrimidine photolyase-related protein|uniref:cryptochrome/photolyase family protein n=1 Tax=Methylophaga sp. TaxID=2024840 RepID=UPI0014008525|nr:cryptochrome/photolyase family protein [Methylophaga sp.]MTI64169.1 cryptochrome/photolyase family protein [Methylophaga sp.]